MTTALYAGTFDPVSNGHLDLMVRAGRLFDRVIVAVAANEEKDPLFTMEERMALIRPNLPPGDHFEVTGFTRLMVDFAREKEADAVIRGIRAVSDFEYEFQMAHMNRHLDSQLETVFLMPTEKHFYLSSSVIKQVARFGGDVSAHVPANVVAALEERFGVSLGS